MFLGRAHLRKRTAVAFRRYEHRVVAEPAPPPRNARDLTLDFAPHRDLATVGPARHRDGGEPRAPVDALAQGVEQLVDVVGVARAFTGVTRRVDARRAIERVD